MMAPRQTLVSVIHPLVRSDGAARALGGRCFGAGLAVLVLAACGSPEPSDGVGDIPRFEGTGSLEPSAPGAGGSTSGAPTERAAQCLPGGSRCDGSRTLETCNASGTAFTVTACEAGTLCLAGACRQPSCSGGETLCFGSEIHTCNADGRSTTLTTTCGAGQACNPGSRACEPLVCEPLVSACDGNVATRCDGTGFAFDFNAPRNECGAQTCMAGACRSPEGPSTSPTPIDPQNPATTPNPTQAPAQTCTPGAVTCGGANIVSTCSADGTTATESRCANGSVCAGAGTCEAVTCDAQALTSFNGGEATVYWFGQGTINFGDIACGFGIQPGNLNNGDGDAVNGIADPTLFVAINTENYRGSASCGACVEMNYQGRSVRATVVDECPIGSNPTCTAGHLDLSRGAWNALTNNAPGTQIFGVNWRFVPCETAGNVTIQLKEPQNQYWNQFLVRGHRYPIARAEVQLTNGTWVEAQRMPYNYFEPPEGIMGTYRVRVTDINGGVIEEQLELVAGAQGDNAQFECQ